MHYLHFLDFLWPLGSLYARATCPGSGILRNPAYREMADPIEGRLNSNSAAAKGQSARAWSACMGCKWLARVPAGRFSHLGASITREARRPTCGRRGSRVSSFKEVEEDGVVGSGRCAAGTGAPATSARVDDREHERVIIVAERGAGANRSGTRPLPNAWPTCFNCANRSAQIRRPPGEHFHDTNAAEAAPRAEGMQVWCRRGGGRK